MAPSGVMVRRSYVRKMFFVATVVAMVTVLTASGASALPGNTPASTLGTNGKVRALLEVNGVMWIGGQFSALSNGSSAANLAALDIDSGQEAGGINVPALGGSGSIVYDLTSDGTTVYAAGKFTASNGAKNLVAFDGTTGALIKSFNAPTLKSVLFDKGRILAGSAKLQAFLPSGAKDTSWTTTTAKIDASIRGHNTVAAFRDVKPAPGGVGYLAACQCDWVLNPGDAQDAGSQTKALVKLSANGSVDHSWTPEGLAASSAAFGIDLYIDGGDVVLAAGGSDFTAKYAVSNGNRVWLTDTNGSSQAVTRYTDGNYIVGGHYRCVENAFHPKLSALSPTSGNLLPSWTVAPSPMYNGIWVVDVDTNGRLWIGGEFKKLGTGWTTSPCSDTHPVATGNVPQQSVARINL